MKKLLAALASVLMVAVLAVSMVACTQGERIRVLDVQLPGEEYGFCVNTEDATLMTSVNELIAALCGNAPFNSDTPDEDHGATGVAYDLNADGEKETVTFATLYEAVMNEEAGAVQGAYTPSTLPAGVELEDCLVVATNAMFRPFEYVIGNGFGGIDMHIAKMLAEQLDRPLVINDMQFEVVIQSVELGNCDIGMAGLTKNGSRAEQVTFSDSYYITAQRIAILESDTTFDGCTTREEAEAVLSGLEGVTAGAANGQTGYFYLVGNPDFNYPGFSNIKTNPYESIDLAMQDLSNGNIDIVVGDKDTVISVANEINGRLPVEE